MATQAPPQSATGIGTRNVGKLIEIKGVVIDAVFHERLPEINTALHITTADGRTIVAEVQQHLGDDRVRAVAMDSTDGLPRGIDIVDTGSAISRAVLISGSRSWKTASRTTPLISISLPTFFVGACVAKCRS